MLLSAGPVYVGGGASFTLSRQTVDVDTDGNGTADLMRRLRDNTFGIIGFGRPRFHEPKPEIHSFIRWGGEGHRLHGKSSHHSTLLHHHYFKVDKHGHRHPDPKAERYQRFMHLYKAAKNKKRAKEFVQFIMQDENLQPYVEGSLGRWYPVTTSGTKSPFWQADPARKAVYNQFGAGTVTFEFVKNYKFTVLNNENVWAKAMSRVVNDGWTPEKATDEMIARIKQVAG